MYLLALVDSSSRLLKVKHFPCRFCRPIMTKPKPTKAATPEAPATPPSQGGESQPHGGDAHPNENAGNATGEAAAASGEPMETEKSENTSNTA